MNLDAEERARMVDDLLERVAETAGRGAHVSAVFGEPVQRAGLTVIPVAKARFGFGGGGGSGSRQNETGSGRGAGGGASVTPVGYIEVRESGTTFRRISTRSDLLALIAATSLFALVVKRLLD